MSSVPVVIAIFIDRQSRVLITQRGLTSSHAGFWEFPGGKVEIDETAEQALKREVFEELGVIVHQANYLAALDYTYPEVSVCLHVYHIIEYAGTPKRCEQQQDLQWVSSKSLPDYLLLESSRLLLAVIEKLIDSAVELVG